MQDQTEERDILDMESKKVVDLLGSLTRVEAPGNFEFGVRARIAAAAESRPQASFIPFFKLAAPLALVLLIAGGVFFYTSMPTGQELVREAAPVEQPASRTDSTQSSAVSPNAAQPSPAPTERALASNPPEQRPQPPVRKRNERPTGSDDRLLVAPQVITPPGIPDTSAGNNNSNRTPQIPLREVLQMIGISADYASGGWKVRSSAEGSISRRAGMQAGDVIDAIDGNKLTESTTFRGTVSPKTFRVLRDGKMLDLTIKN